MQLFPSFTSIPFDYPYLFYIVSLQIVNYGIAGHYEPHFDFARVIFYFIMA